MEDHLFEPYRMIGSLHSVAGEPSERYRNPIGFIWPEPGRIALPTDDEVRKFGFDFENSNVGQK